MTPCSNQHEIRRNLPEQLNGHNEKNHAAMNGKRFSVSQCRLGLVYSYCNQHYERYARLVIDALASRIGLYIPWHAYFNNRPIPAIRTFCWRSKTMFSIIQCPNSVMSRVHAWLLTTIENIILLGHLLLNLKDSYFEPAVGSPPNFARMCGYRPY